MFLVILTHAPYPDSPRPENARNVVVLYIECILHNLGIKPNLLLFIGCLLCTSCANFKTNYTSKSKDWATIAIAPDEEPIYSIYTISDAQLNQQNNLPPAVRQLVAELKNQDQNSAVIFLGNHFNFEEAAKQNDSIPPDLKFDLDALKKFPGQILFAPSPQSWANKQGKGFKKRAKLIKRYLDRKQIWFPSSACSGPEIVELRNDLVVLLIDSQWYLQDWDGLAHLNENCAVKNRKAFHLELDEAFKDNREKNILVALHHPPYSYGPHGGLYPAKAHLLPVPILGSIISFFRSNIDREQDLSNPRYRAFRKNITEQARRNGRFVFASAHEQSLQYIERDSQFFLVSGSGANKTAVGKGNGTHFSYAQHGWSKINYYKDGSSWVEFWSVEPNGNKPKLVFRKKMNGPRSTPKEIDEERFPSMLLDTSIQVAVGKDNFDRGGMWQFLFGKHYREVYQSQVQVPVLDLATFQGGVWPVKKGGGFQTNSLRLQNASGQQFSMRSVDKDARKTIPYPYNQSFAVDLVQDNFSASHPFAAVAISALAGATGIYHTNPKIYYVPHQSKLAAYNQDFGDALYLVEEHPSGTEWKTTSFFGQPKDIISTKKVLAASRAKQNHRIDQKLVVRSRLFDMLLGDWDRHEDQWKWSLIDTSKIKYYSPIPRDRDQAFSQYDGFLMPFIRNAAATTKQWRPYTDGIKRIKWGNYNARHFDPVFTSEMEWEDWEREAKLLQTLLTDALIDSVFQSSWPANIYQISAPAIIKSLKSRRDKLLDITYRYYLFQAKKVDITGTEQKELFEVIRQNSEQTLVRIYALGRNLAKQELLYERTFLSGHTKEINLYGLAGKDRFVIRGEVDRGPKLRLIGGKGRDEYLDYSKVLNSKKRNEVYDHVAETNPIQYGISTQNRKDKNPLYHTYDRRATDQEYNFTSLFPYLSINPDDGLLFGAYGSYTSYAFRKEPYGAKQSIGLYYGLAAQGVRFTYEGDFTAIFRTKWDLLLPVRAQTPFYALNFYGLGNDSQNPEVLEDRAPAYNRIQQRLVDIKPLLIRSGKVGYWGFGPTIEVNQMDRTTGRYIDDIGDEFDPRIFTGFQYAGMRVSFAYDNVDEETLPSRGLKFQTEGGWKYKLGDYDQHFPYIDAVGSAYQRIDRRANLVFATQIGLQHRFRNDFDFFQAAYLSGTGPQANFRGVRRNRYGGKTAFFQNNDLRWKIIGSHNRLLPFSMGVLAGFDHGRVWLDKSLDTSSTWHYSYGGGIWVSPLDRFMINLGLFKSDEDWHMFTFLGSYFF